ncbi:MAG: TonB-dependent receptor [Gammaproteobacteria bacterium]|nr:TonB-dependent receptor [Gammaproteobacteria bacterium]
MSPAIYQSARSPEAQPSPPRLHVSFSPFASSAAAGLSFYGLMGRGFRAPSVHENFGRGDTGVICSQGRRGFACYKWVSNPVLEAEISESREAGIRYNFNGLFSTTDQLRLQLGYVNNDSTDFIDQADLDLGEIVINGRRTHMDQ